MRRIIALIIVTCTVLSLSMWLSSPRARADATVAGYSSGFAHGAFATLPLASSSGSSSTTLGPIAPVWEGCDTAPSVTGNNSTSSASLSTLASVNSTHNTVTTQRSADAITAQALSKVHGADILNGLITAGDIITAANSVGTLTNATSNETGSQISGLNVAGVPISALPAPNTTIQLPGVGYVVLNEIAGPYNGDGSANSSISVNMIDLHITTPTIPNVTANSDVIVGHASTNFFRTSAPALVSGTSQALSFAGNTNGNTASVTPIAIAEIGCGGGNAQNTVNNSTFSNVGTTGTVDDTATGQIGAQATTVTSQSNISKLNLLNGLIQGPAVTSTATATWNGSGSGSLSVNLSNLTIAGTALNSSPPPNTREDIPGLGYAILNEQSSNTGPGGVNESVNAIDIVVTNPNNQYGLAAGAQLIIGYANAGVTAY